MSRDDLGRRAHSDIYALLQHRMHQSDVEDTLRQADIDGLLSGPGISQLAASVVTSSARKPLLCCPGRRCPHCCNGALVRAKEVQARALDVDGISKRLHAPA